MIVHRSICLSEILWIIVTGERKRLQIFLDEVLFAQAVESAVSTAVVYRGKPMPEGILIPPVGLIYLSILPLRLL